MFNFGPIWTEFFQYFSICNSTLWYLNIWKGVSDCIFRRRFKKFHSVFSKYFWPHPLVTLSSLLFFLCPEWPLNGNLGTLLVNKITRNNVIIKIQLYYLPIKLKASPKYYNSALSVTLESIMKMIPSGEVCGLKKDMPAI